MSTQTAAGETSDVELVRAFQDGNVEAFDRLFARYHARITAMATRMVRDIRLAEDITQETFFRVLRALPDVDDEFNFSAWIYRIASNLCLDELRRGKRAQGPTGEEGQRVTTIPGVVDPGDVLMALASDERGEQPDEALAMSELRREVVEVAGRLPANYRRILNLREVTGLSYDGIAEAMGLSESAVETLLHRARRRFKQEFLYLGFERADGPDRCDAVAELLGAVKLSDLRSDQREAVLGHARECPNCSGMLPKP